MTFWGLALWQDGCSDFDRSESAIESKDVSPGDDIERQRKEVFEGGPLGVR